MSSGDETDLEQLSLSPACQVESCKIFQFRHFEEKREITKYSYQNDFFETVKFLPIFKIFP